MRLRIKALSEDKYIRKRKRKAKRLSYIFRLFGVLPIRKNKIVVTTFEGDGGYCCNPRYIVEELMRRGKEYDIVWLTHNTDRDFPPGIKVVKDTYLNMAYHLSTAQVWIDNYRKPYGTVKRKNQFYIQTWHASIGFKAVGLYRGELFPKIAEIVSRADSNLADYFISNSDYCDKIYPKKLLYNGKTLRTGSPRVDCLINSKEKYRQEIRKRYGISIDAKILLFAPTFRGGNQKEKKEVVSDIPQIDFARVKEILEKKTKKEWYILVRLHPQLAGKMEKMPLLATVENMVDVSQADDISELLAATDLLITDYSSCAFDALFATIPTLLYADDVEEYIKNRGMFMWKKEELPFDIAENNDELVHNICNFDMERYQKRAYEFMQTHGVVEDGHASERVADVIEEYIKNLL